MIVHTILFVADQKKSTEFYFLPDPSLGRGLPRVEIYLKVDGPELFHQRVLGRGMKELSPIQPRVWGDRAGYSLDPDGHVLAFASK